ncbi:hypothetical protein DFJ74DRAFT_633527 [Hyaloraphidium curvatum]|nr:hypothetical protein DFJ74DRAFT_633527 [Hyaloraphidium curvatum]
MPALLALLPLLILPALAAAHDGPVCDHAVKNRHLRERGLSGGALVVNPVDWTKYKNETFTYRGRTWTIPNQNTSEPYFDWKTVDGCNDDSYVYSCPQPNVFVLSYDDGPSNYTSDLLDILARYNTKATLCMVGRQINLFPEVVLRAAQEGHDLCIHSDNHLHLPSLPTRQMIDEVVNPIEKLKEILGVTPKFFRPPYGEMDLRLKAILEQTGLIALRWNFDSFDSKNATVLESVQRFVGAMKTPNEWTYGSPAGDGYISLMHDVYETTVKELTPDVMPVIPENKFKIVNPSECLNTARFVEGEAAFTRTATATRTAAASATGSASTSSASSAQATRTVSKTKEESGAGGIVVGGLSALAAAGAIAALL